MKKIYFLLAVVLFFFNSKAQYLQYGFSSSQGVFTPLSGATSVSTLTSVSDFLGDTKTSVAIPIGFIFKYDNVDYTNVVAASDGFISFNTTATSTFTNNLASTQQTRRPLLAPLWDDLSGASGSASASYQTTGIAGSRIFTIEWLNWQWSYSALGATISFQVRLYEGSNKIEFVYRQQAGAVSNGSASIGIAGVAPGVGNFLSLNNAGPLPLASLSTETSTIADKPATGQVYTFAPLTACSGAPDGGVTTNNSMPTCINAAIILDVTGGSSALTLGFQWQSSTDGQNWTDIPLATAPFYVVNSVSVAAYFRRRVMCSGNQAYSVPISVNPASAPVNDDYCNALPLTQATAEQCGNTTCATSIGDPVFSKSTPNNTVWYTYTPSVTGPATIVMSRPAGLMSGFLNGWLGIFTTSAACPNPVFTELVSSLPYNLVTANSVTLTTPSLTAGTTYYLMIDGSSGLFGAFCIRVAANPALPSCTNNLSPANGSTVTTSYTTLTWNTSLNATAYDIMISEDNGATYVVKSTVSGNADTSYNLLGLKANFNYYWYVVPRNGGGSAAGCQSSAFLLYTAAPPPCATPYILPMPNAAGVLVNTNVIFEWSASAGATSYDHYLGTTNPPTLLYKNTTNTRDTITLLSYNTRYYWSVSPKNNFSSVGCAVDSFTTAPPLSSCSPLYNTGVALGDSIAAFRLKGENNTQVANKPALTNNSNYSDYYSTTNVFLGIGSAYVGFVRTGASGDRITAWIDFNDNGFFENNERLLNNQNTTNNPSGTYFSIYLPATAITGEHRMRIRNVYGQTIPVDACSAYEYGETEDYKVTVQSPYVLKNISPGINNSCFTLASTTIDIASNNSNSLVPILDTAGNVVMALNATGNNLGSINFSSLYVNSDGIRTSGNGIKYLDRNYLVTPSVATVNPVTVRFYFTSQDLQALQLADPSVSGRSSINLSKTSQLCEVGGPSPNFATFYSQLGNGAYNSDHFVDFSIVGFSEFYLHGGVRALPVTELVLKGEKLKSKNVLQWSTFTEINNSGFEVQRSVNANAFTTLQFLTSKAINGNSTNSIDYLYDDLKPLNGIGYYRLKQIDKDGQVRFSNTIALQGNTSEGPVITSVYPNPAKSVITVAIHSSGAQNIMVRVTDAAGRVVMQKPAKITHGNNSVPLNVAPLSRGNYMLRILCASGCETTIKTFVRQ